MKATPQSIMQKMRNLKSKDSTDLLKEKSKGTLTGALIGAGVGLLYAFRGKKSYLICGVLGLLAGGFVSNFFIDKSIKKEESDSEKKQDDE